MPTATRASRDLGSATYTECAPYCRVKCSKALPHFKACLADTSFLKLLFERFASIVILNLKALIALTTKECLHVSSN